MLIKNGTIILTDDVFTGDIRIEGEIFTQLAPELVPLPDEEIIDATGLLVMAGAIDAHTHFDLDTGTAKSPDDFYFGTRAAISGGTTTILDFATQNKGSTLKSAVSEWDSKAKDKCYCDYGYHMAITDWNSAVCEELSEMVQCGISSFKMYMAYKGILQVDDGAIYEALEASRRVGGLIGFHCENGDLIQARVNENRLLGHTAAAYHAATRPESVEVEAINRLITIAELAKAPAWIVHLSTGQGLELAAAARAKGQGIVVETCPQYLLLDDSVYGGSDNQDFEVAKYVISPPLRSKMSQAMLWQGLQKADIDFISTDHCSFNYKVQKELGRSDYSKIPNGAPGVEHRLMLMYTYGVCENKLSLPQLTRLLSAGAAQVFGLTQKGSITVGKDADFVLYDPTGESTITAKDQVQNVDYTPYEGFKIRGKIRQVFLRGQKIVDQGRIVPQAAVGQFQKRKNSGPIEKIG